MRRNTILGLLVLPLFLACGGDGLGPGAPTAIVIDRGNNQTARINSSLVNPLGAAVYNQDGEFAEGVAVTWLVLTGGGTITANESRTDEFGLVTANWVLGPTVGEQTVSAAVDGLPPVIFVATASQ